MGRKNRNKHDPYASRRIDKTEERLLRCLKAEWARNHPKQYPRANRNESSSIPKPTNQNKWDNEPLTKRSLPV